MFESFDWIAISSMNNSNNLDYFTLYIIFSIAFM
ncbi:hypothetical protein CK476_27500, partial [Escherichia coli]